MSNKRSRQIDWNRERRARKGDIHWQHGPTVLTQLPDYVIAERCQNAAEKRSMHIRQRARRRGGEVEERGKRKGENQEVSSEKQMQMSQWQAQQTWRIQSPTKHWVLISHINQWCWSGTLNIIMKITVEYAKHQIQHQCKHIFFLFIILSFSLTMVQDAFIFCFVKVEQSCNTQFDCVKQSKKIDVMYVY